MPIGDRLSELLKERKTNPNRLSKATGVSAATIYSIVRRNNTKVNLDDLQKICDELGVTLDYFSERIDSISREQTDPTLKQYEQLSASGQKAIGHVVNEIYQLEQELLESKITSPTHEDPERDKAEDAMKRALQRSNEFIIRETAKSVPHAPIERETIRELRYVSEEDEATALEDYMQYRVPVIGRVAAGNPMFVYDDPDDSVRVTSDMWEEGLVALRLQGNSMEPDYPNGSCVIVKPTNTANIGDLVIAIKDINDIDGSEATFKILNYRNGKIILRAINPAYADQSWSTKKTRIFGIVIGTPLAEDYE